MKCSPNEELPSIFPFSDSERKRRRSGSEEDSQSEEAEDEEDDEQLDGFDDKWRFVNKYSSSSFHPKFYQEE